MSFVTAPGRLEAFGAGAGWSTRASAAIGPASARVSPAEQQQRAVVFEHLRVQTHELLAGLQSELGREAAPRAGKRVERIGLASGSVQRQHQLTPQPLLERVRRHQRLELGHELAGRTRGKVGVDAQQQRLKLLLLERTAPLGDASLAGARRTTGRRGRGRGPH